MVTIGFPSLSHHHEVHDLVRGHFEKMCKQFSGFAERDLTYFFDSVMKHHLDDMDTQYIPYYKKWLQEGGNQDEWQ